MVFHRWAGVILLGTVLAGCGAGGTATPSAASFPVISTANVDQLAEQSVLPGRVTWVSSLDFSPRGDAIVVGDQGGGSGSVLWRLPSGEEVGHFDGNLSAVFSPDGSLIATAGWENVKLWDVNTGELAREMEGHDDWVNEVEFSEQNGLLVSGAGLNSFAGTAENVRIWDVETGEERLAVSTGESVKSVAITSDGSVIAAGLSDGTLLFWNTSDNREITRIAAHEGTISSLVFSPDGSLLVSAGVDGTAQLWDVASAGLVRTFQGHSDEIAAAAFSPDGSLLATASYDGTARLWDAASGEELAVLEIQSDVDYSRTRVTAVAFSDDGGLLAIGVSDGTVHLWAAGGS